MWGLFHKFWNLFILKITMSLLFSICLVSFPSSVPSFILPLTKINFCFTRGPLNLKPTGYLKNPVIRLSSDGFSRYIFFFFFFFLWFILLDRLTWLGIIYFMNAFSGQDGTNDRTRWVGAKCPSASQSAELCLWLFNLGRMFANQFLSLMFKFTASL